MKRFALILLALAATAMLSGCWNSSGTAQPSPTASLAPTATADNPVEGALDELATDMPGSLEGGAATTAPLDENAGGAGGNGLFNAHHRPKSAGLLSAAFCAGHL